MMRRILAHQPDLGNGVGLHYSGFHRFSAVPASPNQLLAPIQPRENRRHRSPIREVGLAAHPAAASAHGATSGPAQTARQMVGSQRRSERADAESRHLLAETRLPTPIPLAPPH